MKGDLYQYSEDGTVKQVAGMRKPEKMYYSCSVHPDNCTCVYCETYNEDMVKYSQHLASLNPNSIPVEPKPDWKDGQIVERGVDFEIFHQWYVGFNGQQPTWQDCTGAIYFTYYEDKRRLRARPIAKEQAALHVGNNDLYPGKQYQRLFDFMHAQLGSSLLNSEMQEIIQIVHEDFPAAALPEETFEDYIKNARNEFVEAVGNQEWDTELRTAAENILIAYDQMRDKLSAPHPRENYVPGERLIPGMIPIQSDQQDEKELEKLRVDYYEDKIEMLIRVGNEKDKEIEQEIELLETKVYDLTLERNKSEEEIERLKGLIEKAFNYYYMRGFPHNGHDEEWKQFTIKNNIWI